MDYMWLIIAIAAAPVGQVFFKVGMLKVGESPQNFRKLPRFLLRVVSNPHVICAIILTVVMSVSFTLAVSKSQLSFVYPLVAAIPLVLVVIFSSLLFKEKVTGLSWLGIATICVGVVLLGIAMG